MNRAVVMALMGMVVMSASGAESLTRELTPWWESGSTHARAMERLDGITPKEWTKEERRWRTLEFTPAKGNSQKGEVLFLDAFAKADVFHYVEDPKQFKGGLHISYKVEEPADVALRSSSGSAYWRFERGDLGAAVFYARGALDVSKPGVFSAEAPFFNIMTGGWMDARPLTKGTYCYYSKSSGFHQVDRETGAYLKAQAGHYAAKRELGFDYMNMQLIPEIKADMSFTVADLSRYTLNIDKVVTDWGKSGFVGAIVTITDANGETFDVPGAEVTAYVQAEDHEMEAVDLYPEEGFFGGEGDYTLRYRFTGKYAESIFDPETVTIQAKVVVQGPDGVLREEILEKTINKADAPVASLDNWLKQGLERKPRRTADGTLMETRYLYIHQDVVRWWESVEKMKKTIAACAETGVNVLCPGIRHHGESYVQSRVAPMRKGVPQDVDMFKLFIEEAKKAGMVVLPNISCAQGGKELRALHPEWTVIKKDGSEDRTEGGTADMLHPAYQQHLLDYIRDIVTRYDIVGMELDFIRVKVMSYSEERKRDFRAKFGKDLMAVGVSDPDYQRYCADGIDSIVRRTHEMFREINPALTLSSWGSTLLTQGRNPIKWTNNGWLNWWAYEAYNTSPEHTVKRWIQYASEMKEPWRAWPSLACYTTRPLKDEEVTEELWHAPEFIDITGDKYWGHKKMGWRLPRAGLKQQYEAMREQCNASGFLIFDLTYLPKKSRKSLKEDVFVEPAVPWFPGR